MAISGNEIGLRPGVLISTEGMDREMSLTLSTKAEAVKPSSTLAITAKAKEMRANGIDVVGFGAGEPDFNTPKNICDAAIKAIEDGFTKYTPASGTNELKAAISRKFKEFNGLDYKPNQIVVSNGGKHSLTNIFMAILNPGDEVIIPAPYWLSYPEMVKMADGVPVIVYATKETQYKVTAAQIEAACTEKTKAVILNSPNNPTGMIYHREELQAIADVAIRKDIYVVSDEMYENLVYDGEEQISIASLGPEIYERTITCSGFSKGYAMTGWRLGYTGSSKDIAKLMGAIQSHATSNPNSIAQKAAEEALNGPQDSVEMMRQKFDERRKYMYNRVKNFPHVDVVEPKGAFYVFVDLTDALTKTYHGHPLYDGTEVARFLIEDYAVAVIPCGDFGFPNNIRLSYAISNEDIAKGLDRIEQFLNELK